MPPAQTPSPSEANWTAERGQSALGVARADDDRSSRSSREASDRYTSSLTNEREEHLVPAVRTGTLPARSLAARQLPSGSKTKKGW